MPIRRGARPQGKERDRSARITPSDIADAKLSSDARVDELGRRMFASIEDEQDDTGPVPDA